MEHRIRITPEAEVADIEQVSALITRCAQAALEAEQAPEGCFVDVTIVDGDTIREINRQNRDKDAVTDVLSFPMLEFYNGEWPENVDIERNPEDHSLFLGDMILNYDRAVEQAEEYGHPVERECGFLTVHSMLHLLGYDHERSEEERRIQRKHEEAVLSKLGLSRETDQFEK
ncbi:MAG: rRNA maturation RNase YbeY [Eubacteriales bacterium]|nr:rRNA maturation RNase YbeY [Eubacteriales bacterium]